MKMKLKIIKSCKGRNLVMVRDLPRGKSHSIIARISKKRTRLTKAIKDLLQWWQPGWQTLEKGWIRHEETSNDPNPNWRSGIEIHLQYGDHGQNTKSVMLKEKIRPNYSTELKANPDLIDAAVTWCESECWVYEHWGEGHCKSWGTLGWLWRKIPCRNKLWVLSRFLRVFTMMFT